MKSALCNRLQTFYPTVRHSLSKGTLIMSWQCDNYKGQKLTTTYTFNQTTAEGWPSFRTVRFLKCTQKTPIVTLEGKYRWLSSYRGGLIWACQGPRPSAGGSLVCGGWGGTPAGRDRRTGRHRWTALNRACLIPLHALQGHSKSELEYRNREKSFHARDLIHRYNNANNSNWRVNWGSRPRRHRGILRNDSSARGGGRGGRRTMWSALLGGEGAPSARLSFYASSSSSTLSSAGASGRNLWRQNCNRWIEPTGGRDACSPQASGQKKRHCDIWSSAGGGAKRENLLSDKLHLK